MKGLHLKGAKTIEEKIIEEPFDNSISTKVKITKALLTITDVTNYISGEPKNTVLGGFGLGIVSEPQVDLFNLQRGARVYINPNVPCKKCFNCSNQEYQKCSNLQIAGKDFNGFLRDFIAMESSNLYFLPESVSDEEALFIEYISLSLAIIDKIDAQKGDHIVVIGANNLGKILSQLLIYYQAVPILIDTDEEDLQIAKSSGVYYTLGKDENWQKEVSTLTSGRMAKSVVYISDSEVPFRTAFALAGYNASIAITGLTDKSSAVSFTVAMKKQLIIHCVNSGYGYTASSINLIANKAFNIKNFKIDYVKYQDVEKTLADMAEKVEKDEKINDTIVDLL